MRRASSIAQARVQRLERGQRDADVGGLRAAVGSSTTRHRDAGGPERVLHDAGREPHRRIAPDDDDFTHAGVARGAHELTAGVEARSLQ